MTERSLNNMGTFFSICSYVFWGLAVIMFIRRNTSDDCNTTSLDMMLISYITIGTICYILRNFCH